MLLDVSYLPCNDDKKDNFVDGFLYVADGNLADHVTATFFPARQQWNSWLISLHDAPWILPYHVFFFVATREMCRKVSGKRLPHKLRIERVMSMKVRCPASPVA